METSWRWQAVGQRRWRYQSRPFVLLLDMHKCQSDYNAEPAMCLSFCRMLHCPSPFPSSQPCPLAALKGAKKGQGSECYNALSWMGIQSFIRSLAAYTPIEHEDDDAQWSSDRNWASDPPPPAEVLGPGNRTCPLRTASEIRLDVRRCAYWRSTALRLSTSRKSQPDQSQRTPCFPPWWQAVFAPLQSWIWLLLNIFGNFKNPFRPQLSQMLKAFLVVLLDDVQFLRWTEAITVSEMGEDSNSMTTFV